MTIIEALQYDKINVRVTCGWRWMCCGLDSNFVVYERLPGQKKTLVLVETMTEEIAVAWLMGEDKE